MLTMRHVVALLLSILMLSAVSALALEGHHALVLLHTDSPAGEQFLQANQGRLDIVASKPGHFIQVAALAKDMELLRSSGLTMEILEEDMEAHYADRLSATNKVAGYGVYHTLTENIAFQDSLHLLYPNVVSEKWSIGQSHEGRDLWCFRVSANPDIDEDEPEILIDGGHHAREIMASEFPIMFVEYLAINYGIDPEITWLLDNRELYVVPVVNPDGVAYNEAIQPNGGGMWRKNRRNNGDGTHGVDPNRNYPFEWVGPGSSTDTSSDLYRGPSAGSEPEIQALMAFINSRNFITHDSVHTYSNLLLYPWGYTTADSPDHDIFVHMSQEMTRYNGYEAGQGSDILYDVNGGANDWVYAATSEHNQIFSFTSEIGGGGDGFWPEENRRGALFEENIWPHIYLMRAAGTYISVHTPVVTATAKSVQPGESGVLDFTVENQSVVGISGAVNISLKSDDPFVQFWNVTRDLGTIPAMTGYNLGIDPIPFTVDPACPGGHIVEFTVTVQMAGDDQDIPLSFMVGDPVSIFADNFESGLGNWTTTGSWSATSSAFHSLTTSLTDSPSGEYNDDASTSATINGSYQAATLSFWHKYDIEDNYDYGRVQVSANNGGWVTLASYDGLQSSFSLVELDLSAYQGQDLRFRFMLETDYSVTEDGWYIDDVVLTGVSNENGIPETPLAISPAAGASTSGAVTFTVANSFDPEGDPVSYGFRVYTDALLTNLAGSADAVVSGIDQTSWSTTLTEGTYFWRAYAGDGTDRSSLSEALSFNVEATSPATNILISGPMLRVLDRVGSGSARIELSLPGSRDVSVAIYDARGARIRQLHAGGLQGGTTTMMWDGRDTQGRAASSGVYFVRMTAGNEALTGRVIVVR